MLCTQETWKYLRQVCSNIHIVHIVVYRNYLEAIHVILWCITECFSTLIYHFLQITVKWCTGHLSAPNCWCKFNYCKKKVSDLFASLVAPLVGQLCNFRVNLCVHEPEVCTLLKYGLWPATPDKPQTAFSQTTMEANISTHWLTCIMVYWGNKSLISQHWKKNVIILNLHE